MAGHRAHRRVLSSRTVVGDDVCGLAAGGQRCRLLPGVDGPVGDAGLRARFHQHRAVRLHRAGSSGPSRISRAANRSNRVQRGASRPQSRGLRIDAVGVALLDVRGWTRLEDQRRFMERAVVVLRADLRRRRRVVVSDRARHAGAAVVARRDGAAPHLAGSIGQPRSPSRLLEGAFLPGDVPNPPACSDAAADAARVDRVVGGGRCAHRNRFRCALRHAGVSLVLHRRRAGVHAGLDSRGLAVARGRGRGRDCGLRGGCLPNPSGVPAREQLVACHHSRAVGTA